VRWVRRVERTAGRGAGAASNESRGREGPAMTGANLKTVVGGELEEEEGG
jgi:hypothetical protein